MLVKDIMNTDPLMIAGSASLEEAVMSMARHKKSCLMVVSDGLAMGIITERDITLAFADGLSKDSQPVVKAADVMTPEPVCVSQTTRFSDALTLSRSRKLRHLPVVDENDKLIGVVTQTDLVNAYALILEEQARLESNIEELKLLSLEDALMGIGNRRAMEVDLAFTAAESKRHHKHYALALFDIDFFKRYNDCYGHQAGDDALRKVAAAIKQAVRDSDRVFRYGGEEILVLMPETDLAAGKVCAERVRQAVEGEAIPHQDAPLGRLTISGGLASALEGAWQQLVEQADQALYQAKHAGRNRIEWSEK